MRASDAIAFFSAAAVAALACSACSKKDEAAADAGPPPIPKIENDDLGFYMELDPNWGLQAKDAAKADQVGEARRKPTPGHTYLVIPRLVVNADPTDERDATAVIRTAMNELRALGDQRGVEVEKMTMSTRRAGSFEVGDIELSYGVRTKREDTPQVIVHRSLVTRLPKKDGSAYALTVTVTYLQQDADLVAPEVHRMLATLRLIDPFEPPPGGPKVEPR